MDRENSPALLWPEWGSNPIPSDPQSGPRIDCATGSGEGLEKNAVREDLEAAWYFDRSGFEPTR
jgi:hypothetical protein